MEVRRISLAAHGGDAAGGLVISATYSIDARNLRAFRSTANAGRRCYSSDRGCHRAEFKGRPAEAREALAAEDPSFVVSTDVESGQTILKGTSEEHLDAKIGFLKRDGISANIGAPQVAFRERITQRVEHSYTHKKQTGRTGQFASVTLIVEPNEPDKGYVFESKIVGDAVPKEYIPGV
jgi:hypothetical protein